MSDAGAPQSWLLPAYPGLPDPWRRLAAFLVRSPHATADHLLLLADALDEAARELARPVSVAVGEMSSHAPPSLPERAAAAASLARELRNRAQRYA